MLKLRREWGSALVIILVFTSVLAMMVGAVGLLTVQNLNQASQRTEEKIARYAAYGGIQKALEQVTANPNWPGSHARTELAVGDLEGSSEMQYQLQVINNVHSANVVPAVMAPDNSWVPGMSVWVECRGFRRGSDQKTGLVALLSASRPVFDHAAYGLDRFEARGDVLVDSWDSRNGEYSQTYDPSDAGSASKQGDVGSNGSIALDGATVDGDLVVGPSGAPGGIPNISQIGSEVSGSNQIAQRNKLNLSFTAPAGMATTGPAELVADNETVTLTPGTYESISAGNHSVVRLQSGTYYIRDKMDLKGAQVIGEGSEEEPVVLYVGKELTAANGTVINGGKQGNPNTFQTYFTDEDTTGSGPKSTLKIDDGSQVNFVAAGRWVQAYIGEGDLYGSLVAVGTAVQPPPGKHAGLHYDRTLKGKQASKGRSTWRVVALRDESPAELLAGTGGGSGPVPPRPRDWVAVSGGAGGRVTGTAPDPTTGAAPNPTTGSTPDPTTGARPDPTTTGPPPDPTTNGPPPDPTGAAPDSVTTGPPPDPTTTGPPPDPVTTGPPPNPTTGPSTTGGLTTSPPPESPE